VAKNEKFFGSGFIKWRTMSARAKNMRETGCANCWKWNGEYRGKNIFSEGITPMRAFI